VSLYYKKTAFVNRIHEKIKKISKITCKSVRACDRIRKIEKPYRGQKC
jgi:hypothetical protein